jgi:hypothetical protein
LTSSDIYDIVISNNTKGEPMSKAKVLAKAVGLGYKVDEIDGAILLEAPEGYCFDQDYHELHSYYDTGDKASAWVDVYEHIGKAEVCEIEECDWCNGF